MINTAKAHSTHSVLSITEGGDTKCLLTKRYTDPLFIARRCSIATADKAVGSMMHKAFPEAAAVAQSPELLAACSAAIDFDRGVFSGIEGGQRFNLPLQAVTAAADWCYEWLEKIPPEGTDADFLSPYCCRASQSRRVSPLCALYTAFREETGESPPAPK